MEGITSETQGQVCWAFSSNRGGDSTSTDGSWVQSDLGMQKTYSFSTGLQNKEALDTGETEACNMFGENGKAICSIKKMYKDDDKSVEYKCGERGELEGSPKMLYTCHTFQCQSHYSSNIFPT